MAVVVDRKTRLTYEDYLQFPEDAERIAVACVRTTDALVIELREVW